MLPTIEFRSLICSFDNNLNEASFNLYIDKRIERKKDFFTSYSMIPKILFSRISVRIEIIELSDHGVKFSPLVRAVDIVSFNPSVTGQQSCLDEVDKAAGLSLTSHEKNRLPPQYVDTPLYLSNCTLSSEETLQIMIKGRSDNTNEQRPTSLR